jgi:hypothetical protein
MIKNFIMLLYCVFFYQGCYSKNVKLDILGDLKIPYGMEEVPVTLYSNSGRDSSGNPVVYRIPQTLYGHRKYHKDVIHFIFTKGVDSYGMNSNKFAKSRMIVSLYNKSLQFSFERYMISLSETKRIHSPAIAPRNTFNTQPFKEEEVVLDGFTLYDENNDYKIYTFSLQTTLRGIFSKHKKTTSHAMLIDKKNFVYLMYHSMDSIEDTVGDLKKSWQSININTHEVDKYFEYTLTVQESELIHLIKD